MNIDDVVTEVQTALGTIAGLRVPPWGVESVSPPAAIVLLPERVHFDETYHGPGARGADRYADLEVCVLVPNPTSRTALAQLAPFVAGAGDSSVKAAIEAHDYSAVCDDVHVSYAEFQEVTYAGTPYAAAIFHLDIIGDATP